MIINIVIPMGDTGSRFSNVDYKCGVLYESFYQFNCFV